MAKLTEVEVPLAAGVLSGEQMAALDRMWNWPEPPKVGVKAVKKMPAKMVDRAVTFKLVLDTSEMERSMRRMERGIRRAVREQRALRRANRWAWLRRSWQRVRFMWFRNRDEIAMYAVVTVIAVLAMAALIYLLDNSTP